MLRRREKPVERGELLEAVPRRVPDAKERVVGGGAIEVSIPVRRSRLGRWLAMGDDRPVVRRFELDALGASVWRMMDGRTSVRAMIERFAETHQLNLREAEVAMLTYLRTLAARGMMALERGTVRNQALGTQP